MRYVVIQDFQTPLRRFRVGTKVDDTEVDGPLTALEWVERGYLGAIDPADDDLEALQEEAAALGIEIDGRWRAARLREEIEAKKAADQAEVERLAAGGVPAEPEAASLAAPVEVENDSAKRRRT